MTKPDPVDQQEPPPVISSRTLYEGRVISLRVDEIGLPGGRTAIRETVVHPGAVVIVAVDTDGQVLLVSQYRHAIGRWLLELPAGGLEPREDPMEAAKRELREEVGAEAGRWTPLGSFFSSPGFANERLYAFLAEDLSAVATDPDDDEDIAVVRYPLGRLLACPEETPDAKTLAALLLLPEEVKRRFAKTS